MRKFKMAIVVAVVAASVTAVAASSASAATWRPQGTARAASSSNFVWTDSNGNVFRCTSASTNLTASGSVATARAASGNPVDFSGCSNSLGLSPSTWTTAGTWTLTATSTTMVTLNATNVGGSVLTIRLGSFCTITTTSPVVILNNIWANSPPTFTFNNTTRLAQTSSGCLGLIGATVTWSGTFSVPGMSIA